MYWVYFHAQYSKKQDTIALVYVDVSQKTINKKLVYVDKETSALVLVGTPTQALMRLKIFTNRLGEF